MSDRYLSDLDIDQCPIWIKVCHNVNQGQVKSVYFEPVMPPAKNLHWSYCTPPHLLRILSYNTIYNPKEGKSLNGKIRKKRGIWETLVKTLKKSLKEWTSRQVAVKKWMWLPTCHSSSHQNGFVVLLLT